MVHKERRYCVVSVDSVEELAGLLAGRSWCGCAGFALGDLLFLNDSGAEDAREFAVVRDGIQFESVTFGWCSPSQAQRYIRECQEMAPDAYPVRLPVTNRIDTPGGHGRCGCCA